MNLWLRLAHLILGHEWTNFWMISNGDYSRYVEQCDCGATRSAR